MRLFYRSGIKGNIWKLMMFNFLWKFRCDYLIAALYFSDISGSYTLGLSVLSAVYITGFIFEIITGYFSDRMGRKLTLLLASICFFFAMVTYGFAQSYTHLIIGAIIQGLSGSLVSGTTKATLFETLKQMKKEKLFHHYSGKIDTGMHIGLSLSVFVAGFIALYGYQWAYFTSAVAAIFLILLCLFLQEPEVEHERSSIKIGDIKDAFSLLLKNKQLRYFTILNEWNSGFNETMFYYRVVFYKIFLPLPLIGIMNAVNHIGCAISYWFSGRIIDRFGSLKCLVGGFGIKTIFESLMYMIQNIFSPILFFFASMTYGVTTTTKESLYQQSFSDKQRSTMASIVSALFGIFYALASLIVGFIGDHYGIVMALYTALFLKMIFMPLYIYIFKMKSDHKMT